ncbi:hypothetical protein FQN54_005494 [Arachnomyces sp. PD_36]|nr:hypothetical protein FQN54_005494 [Arachnomyces sp. PD_36]
MADDSIVPTLFSYAGWAFLPNLVTSFLQNLYYRITIRAGSPHPAPGSPRFARHRRAIHLFVVGSYLLYTLYEAFHQICAAGDFYQSLGVPPNADDKTIKSRFRRLAALHHPDKVQQLPGNGSREETDAFFVHLKLAQDTLLDPARRFAYERFGKSVVNWKETKTVYDYLYNGILATGPQYVGGLVTMIVLNMFWWPNWGRYWRFFTFGALMITELILITRSVGFFMPSEYLHSWLSWALRLDSTSYLLSFQILAFLRRASVTIHISISQLAPRGVPKPTTTQPINPALQKQLAQVSQLARTTDMEVTRLLQLGFAPFKGDKPSVETLRRGMKDSLVLGSVRSSPEVKEAVKQVIQRKREAASVPIQES